MQALKFKRKGINKAEKEQRKKSMVLLLLLRPSLILRTAHSYRFRPISTTTNTIIKMSFKFGPYKIDPKEVFYSTHLSYAMVNLRPILPVKRFVDLTADETSDLWITAQKVGSRLECYHNASSLTFSIQDGPEAGQTVPHVHIHIIPRKSGDFENNDEIYDAIDVKEKELKQTLDLDKERKDRSIEEMAQEADDYRSLLS